MENNNNNKIVDIQNTRFIFKTNFSGIPDPNSMYPSSDRVGNVVIPPDMVKIFEDAGCNVRATKPREGEEEGFQPTYFVKAKLSYRDKYGELKPEKLQPVVKLYRALNEVPVLLDEESVATIDEIDIKNISVRLSMWVRPNGGCSLYIRNLSVLQDIDDDPFASFYGEPNVAEEATDEVTPF